MVVTPCLQVRSKSIIVYNLFERKAYRSISQLTSDKKLKERETYTGRLCPGAKKRLTKAVELITQAAIKDKNFTFTHAKTLKQVRAKFRLNFITLTIHSPARMIEGKEGHSKCLEPLLKWLRDHYDLTMYVWKAELQQRGQLHYHITSNCFVPWQELRDKWNDLQVNAGYLSQYQIDKGHKNANSTDVHSVYKIKDMAKYLQKCICKNVRKKDGSIVSEFNKDMQNAQTIGGKVWDCSLNLKTFGHYTIDCGGQLADQEIKNIELAAKKEKGCSIHYTDNCTIYGFEKPAWHYINEFFQQDYKEYLETISNYERKKVKFEPDITVFSTS
jgi:hypothetical protein